MSWDTLQRSETELLSSSAESLRLDVLLLFNVIVNKKYMFGPSLLVFVLSKYVTAQVFMLPSTWQLLLLIIHTDE